ncbi:MAG: glycosyltransferase family 4 protein [Myxococcaceae bacterium]|nr:glycosyltransferase family 4 protein [Myxococcaceae bacterium]
MVNGPLHGIARYALELCRHLPGLAPGWQFQVLVGPAGLPDDLGALHPRLTQIRCAAEFLSPLEQPAMLAALTLSGPALFHATSFSVPLLWPGKLVATLHDATHLALTESSSLTINAYYKAVVRPRASRAKALITVSEFSRGELAAHLQLAPERLQVIPNGVDTAFRMATESELADFRARRGLPERYFAAIGSLKHHKNLKVLGPIAESLPARLTLLAGRGARRALGFPDSVYELSPLSDRDLALFYAGAVAVLVPSRYEGFGLPALEAMACGAPVIAADAGAHREVVGSAGLLVDPDDSAAWLEAAQRLSRDEALRTELSLKARERADRYTWDDCARRTLQVYRRALALEDDGPRLTPPSR